MLRAFDAQADLVVDLVEHFLFPGGSVDPGTAHAASLAEPAVSPRLG